MWQRIAAISHQSMSGAKQNMTQQMPHHKDAIVISSGVKIIKPQAWGLVQSSKVSTCMCAWLRGSQAIPSGHMTARQLPDQSEADRNQTEARQVWPRWRPGGRWRRQITLVGATRQSVGVNIRFNSLCKTDIHAGYLTWWGPCLKLCLASLWSMIHFDGGMSPSAPVYRPITWVNHWECVGSCCTCGLCGCWGRVTNEKLWSLKSILVTHHNIDMVHSCGTWINFIIYVFRRDEKFQSGIAHCTNANVLNSSMAT